MQHLQEKVPPEAIMLGALLNILGYTPSTLWVIDREDVTPVDSTLQHSGFPHTRGTLSCSPTSFKASSVLVQKYKRHHVKLEQLFETCDISIELKNYQTFLQQRTIWTLFSSICQEMSPPCFMLLCCFHNSLFAWVSWFLLNHIIQMLCVFLILW